MSIERKTESALIRTAPIRRTRHNLPRTDEIPPRCPTKIRPKTSHYSNKPPIPPDNGDHGKWHRWEGNNSDNNLNLDEAIALGTLVSVAVSLLSTQILPEAQNNNEASVYSGVAILGVLSSFILTTLADLHIQKNRRKK
jgi:hypothetical protein